MGLGASDSCSTPDMLSHITPMGYFGPAWAGFRNLRVCLTPDMLSHITPMGYFGPARAGFRNLKVSKPFSGVLQI